MKGGEMVSVGDNIKRIRKEKKLTQRQLGERLGISQAAIGQFEKGTASPRLDTIKKIASALDVPEADLLGWNENSKLLNSVPSTSPTRVYISGGITDVPDYKRRFARAERHLKKQGFSAINPAKVSETLPEDCEYEDYMKIDLALLDLCDAIYLLRGWENSCGANREYNHALNRGMTIMFEDRTDAGGF